MKRIITNIMATTGISIVALSVIVRLLLPGYDLFFTFVVLQTFGANVVIHLGILFVQRLEVKYVALEVFLDIVYTSIVLIGFGLAFDWFEITPVWLLILMAVVVNLIALFLNMIRVKKDASTINELIKKRKHTE